MSASAAAQNLKPINPRRFEVYLQKTMALIKDKGFLERSRKNKKYFTRRRKLPFDKLICFMLSMVKESITNALERFFDRMGDFDTSVTEQSFSESREKLKWEAAEELYNVTVDIPYEAQYETWRGYRVSAIDGSKIALPNDEGLLKYFGGMGADKSSPTAQGSILYDIYNNVIIDACIEPLSIDERTLAEKHIKKLYFHKSFHKELIIFDRGYPSFELIRFLDLRNIRFVMRVKRKFSWEIDSSKKEDGTVCLTDGKQYISVRFLKFKLPSGEVETLITDLFDKKMGADDFKKLYFKRWPVETKYDEVKNKLEIENFSGRTANAVKQDFYICMYMSNLAAGVAKDAQEAVAQEGEGKGNKYAYHVNVNHEIGVLKDDFIKALCEESPEAKEKKIQRILHKLTRRPAPTRPGRSTPRKGKPRDAHFHHNQKSNC